mmetsp:Transcript_5080/g.18147  ORF Transcript_5080/g.18147 Transcript_5080/m.18147 type:complete len:220 (+) Transcript_5080:2249-2908(+)
MHAPQRRVQVRLRRGDAHALNAQIPHPHRALAVGDDDELDLRLRPVLQDAVDASSVEMRHVQPPRTIEHLAELGAHLPDGIARVHHRHELVRVLDEDAEEQVLVPLLQPDEVQMLRHERVQRAHVFHHALHLRRLRELRGREEAAQPELVALVVRERHALVVSRAAEELVAGDDLPHPRRHRRRVLVRGQAEVMSCARLVVARRGRAPRARVVERRVVP